MYWDEKKLTDLAARITTEFPYPLGRARLKTLKSAKFVLMSQDKKAWRQYLIGHKAYLILFDTMLTGCRHAAKWLLPDDPQKAHALYLHYRKRKWHYNQDVVNDPVCEYREAMRSPNYSPLDIPTEFPRRAEEKYEKLKHVPDYVHLPADDRPPAPVRHLTAEEYYAVRAKEISDRADKSIVTGNNATKKVII